MQRLFPENPFVAPAIGGDTLLCAEAPGQAEAERGEPLVGSSGAWLRGRYDEERKGWYGGLLGQAKIRDADCSRANVIQCRPPDNVFPTTADARSYISEEDAKNAVAHCLEAHVWPLVRGRDWRRLILLGEKSLRALTGKTEGILTWRGSPLPLVDETEPRCIPTLHPAYIARTQWLIPAVVSDLKKSLITPPEFYQHDRVALEVLRDFHPVNLTFDIETNRESGKITMVGVSDRPYHAICVPFSGAYIVELKRIFREAESGIGHNCIQFDLPILRDNGVTLRDGVQVWDTMLLQHLLQPDLPHDLGFLGSIFTNKPAWKHLSDDDEPLYCCRDVDVTRQCWDQLRPLVVQQELDQLYRLVQVPLARICRLMCETGIATSTARVGEVRAKLEGEMTLDEARLPEALRTHTVPVNRRIPAPPGTLSEKTGKPLKFLTVPGEETVTPWRSTAATGEFLYETLQLPVQLHPKSQQPSTDKTALYKLARRCRKQGSVEIAEQIEAIRRLRVSDELITTFAQERFLAVNRLHPHFNVHGTASGRLSSSDPNLQNIPPAARYIYVPSNPDWRFLEVDFSSLENRLTAWFARDTERMARLNQPGFNEHKWVCSRFFGIPYDEVRKDNDKEAPYGKAKRINHGMNYGMGPRNICALYDLDYGEVRKLCQAWKDIFAITARWQEETGALAKSQGWLVTPFGRKRWFYTDSYYTESLSFLPQSTGADICFRTMLGVYWDRIAWPEELLQKVVRRYVTIPQPWRLVLQVHDSLLLEGPGSQVDDVQRLIEEVATQPWPELRNLAIPVESKVGAPGASWGELEAA